MSKPLIQIDDLVREMTDEEFAQYQEDQANSVNLNLETTQE
jgi:hypothetical protein